MNVYQRAEQIAVEFDAIGLPNRATLLRDAIAGGATGGEIHMALRFHLRAILDEETGTSEALQRSIHQLIDDISTALG